MAYDVHVKQLPDPALFTLHAREDAARHLENVLAVKLPSKNAAAFVDGRIVAIGPTEWLLIADADREAELEDRLHTMAASTDAAVVLVSDAYSSFQIDGAQCLQVLSQVVALDLERTPPELAVRCAFGKASAVLIRRGVHTFDILVDSTLTAYAHELLNVCAGLSRNASPIGAVVNPSVP